MKHFVLFVLLLISFAFIYLGCKSGPEVTTTTISKDDKTTTTVENNSVIDNGENDTTTTTIDSRTQFTITDTMSKDVLKKHMEDLFNYIEEKISKGDYEGWFNSLSIKYKLYLSDKKELQKLSERSDYFANRGIVIKDAKEFFELVVIQAREGKKLKFFDYKYVDKFNVKVVCILDDVGKFNYNFVFEDNSWKLDR